MLDCKKQKGNCLGIAPWQFLFFVNSRPGKTESGRNDDAEVVNDDAETDNAARVTI